MKLTPKNLLSLSEGRYWITVNPYTTNPEFEHKSLLRAWEDSSGKKFCVGDVFSSYSIRVETDEKTGELFLKIFAVICNELFRMDEFNVSKMENYTITKIEEHEYLQKL